MNNNLKHYLFQDFETYKIVDVEIPKGKCDNCIHNCKKKTLNDVSACLKCKK